MTLFAPNLSRDRIIHELVKHTLKNWHQFDGWTLQGFGMLRLYMPNTQIRMAIWHERYRVPGVSMIHTHPWHFQSYVVCGFLKNRKYMEGSLSDGERYLKHVIRAGEGGGLVGKPVSVTLTEYASESVSPGNFYSQEAHEIHETDPVNGTVTLCDRYALAGDDPHHALVYYPEDEAWGSAEPRKAHPNEIRFMVEAALERMELVK